MSKKKGTAPKHSFSLSYDPGTFLNDEGVREAYAGAASCAALAQSTFHAVRSNLPWELVSDGVSRLQQEIADSEYQIETMYEDFAECGLRVVIGNVDEISAHAAALALAMWVIQELWTSATEPEFWFDEFTPTAVRDNYSAVVKHFASLPHVDTAELNTLLKQEAILAAKARRQQVKPLANLVTTDEANPQRTNGTLQSTSKIASKKPEQYHAAISECETRSKEIAAGLARLVAKLPDVSNSLIMKQSWTADCERVYQLALAVGAIEILSDLKKWPPIVSFLISAKTNPNIVFVGNAADYDSAGFIAETSYQVKNLWDTLANWCRSKLLTHMPTGKDGTPPEAVALGQPTPSEKAREAVNGVVRVITVSDGSLQFHFRELTGREVGDARGDFRFLDEYLAAKHGIASMDADQMTIPEIDDILADDLRKRDSSNGSGAGNANGKQKTSEANGTPTEIASTKPGSIDWDGLLLSPPLTSREIAERLGQPLDPVARALNYFRKQHDFGFIPDDDAGVGEARYRYKLPEVLSHLQKWIAKRHKKASETTY